MEKKGGVRTREYRIVCDRQMIRKDTDTGRTAKLAPCQTIGQIYDDLIITSPAEADSMLAYLKEQCAEYDAKTAKSNRYSRRVIQKNIRIQMRETTPWTDLDMTEAPDQS